MDTSYFYTEQEEIVNRSLNVRYFYRAKLKKKAKKINKRMDKLEKMLSSENVEDKKDLHKFCSIKSMECQLKPINKQLSIVENDIREMKKELRGLMDLHEGQRRLSIPKLKSRDIVSLFNSSLIRYIGIPINSLTMDIIIVKTFYFKVLESIIKDGFTIGNHEYIPFTASAGQIRTKKTVFIRKSVFKDIEMRLTCGLTDDVINSKGGVNINKYLAYLALSNSATEVWNDFDITKSIVVEDMETMVTGVVDYIDYNDYSINRQEMDVPIPHTDGCGMMLPKINDKSTRAMMVRLPWVKGLMIPFPFDKFIRQHNRNRSTKIGKITDIYGVEHDILKDGIEVIFTKSQFKMWKFYADWKEYQTNFIDYGCEAGYCNKEHDKISDFGNAKLNYQMLQTLTEITTEELEQISSKTAYNIKQMGRDRKVMLRAMGVVPQSVNKNSYQRALEVYPEMLKDTYSRQTIKKTKKSMVDGAKGARLNIDGKYTFLVPDLYAVAQHIFEGIEKPVGILKDGEVSCKLYADKKELDCLRSPHLYREHAVRTNVLNKDTTKWFISNGIYTSSHDLISKMLQFDK